MYHLPTSHRQPGRLSQPSSGSSSLDSSPVQTQPPYPIPPIPSTSAPFAHPSLNRANLSRQSLTTTGTKTPFGSTVDLVQDLASSDSRYGSLGSSPSRKNLRAAYNGLAPGESSRSVASASQIDPFVIPAFMTTADGKEDDDWLHNPDPKLWAQTKHLRRRGGFVNVNWRGLRNIGCLILLVCIIFGAFVGYPVTSAVLEKEQSTFGAYNIGGLNASGQVPEMTTHSGLIDKDTPQNVRTKKAPRSGKDMILVFSDEFETDGRTFYPGDDPYWEAVDLHYWQTNNLEWYDPSQITTKDGHLEIKLEQVDPTNNHDLKYRGGMVASWNKFCFTGGYAEASVTLPGYNNVNGLWPAIWMMGNLGRAGYGASLDGLWPYTYDSCDVGTLKNQSLNGFPAAATTEGDAKYDNSLSYLSGQRLSACTCGGQDDVHPGPKRGNGYVGRAAPEIDFFEAQVSDGQGAVSQSAQIAPFDQHYEWQNATNAGIENSSISKLNGFKGNVYQEAASVVSVANQNCYEFAPATGCFATYGVEYKPGFDDAYISWINDGIVAWTLLQPGFAANDHVGIGSRPIPQEPLYLIMNLGLSENFGTIEFDKMTFPVTMKVDWIRVYQEEDQINIGCNPKDFPTTSYINAFSEAYINPNLTTWADPRASGGFAQPVPKNSLIDSC